MEAVSPDLDNAEAAKHAVPLLLGSSPPLLF